MHAHLISDTGSKEAEHYRAIDLQELRGNAFDNQLKLVLNELQLGEPKTCNDFAEFCAERLSNEIAYALCLAKINGDNDLHNNAVSDLNQHVENSRAEFTKAEVERRITAAQVSNLAMLERAYV